MMEKNYNHLRSWLPPLIGAKGLTLEKFARRSKISRAAVYAYMTDRNRPETQQMARMCKVLGVSLQEGLSQYVEKKRGRPSTGGKRKPQREIA